MKQAFISRNKKLIIASLVFNSIIILMELFGLSEVFFRYLPGTEPFKWYHSLTYYTNLSNLILMIGCCLALAQDIRCLRNKGPLKLNFLVKFTSVNVAMVTCVTVYFFVIITANIRLAVSVHGNMWLLMHTLCPLFGLCSFLFFDAKYPLRNRAIWYPIGLTILYTIMIEIIFLTGGRVPYSSDLTESPLQISWWFILVCGLVELAITFLVSFSNKTFSNKIIKHLEKNTLRAEV